MGSDSERTFNLNDSSVPTASQALMTMYRRRSPEEFNPKLVGLMHFGRAQLKAINLEEDGRECSNTLSHSIDLYIFCSTVIFLPLYSMEIVLDLQHDIFTFC